MKVILPLSIFDMELRLAAHWHQLKNLKNLIVIGFILAFIWTARGQQTNKLIFSSTVIDENTFNRNGKELIRRIESTHQIVFNLDSANGNYNAVNYTTTELFSLRNGDTVLESRRNRKLKDTHTSIGSSQFLELVTSITNNENYVEADTLFHDLSNTKVWFLLVIVYNEESTMITKPVSNSQYPFWIAENGDQTIQIPELEDLLFSVLPKGFQARKQLKKIGANNVQSGY